MQKPLFAIHSKLFGPDELMMEEIQATPSQAQRNWMALKFGMFVHFGINTYFDTEWSDGTLDAQKFDPKELDTDQWCRVAKAAGMRYIVITAKHHDGFCLWPSQYTDYSVAASPFFKGDVIADLAESASRHDLKLGLYYSLWDRNCALHDQNDLAYVEYMKNQLDELLSNYGPIVCLWFDGFWKKQSTGWTKKVSDDIGEHLIGINAVDREDQFIHAWRMEGSYRWQMDHVYGFIKERQPDCLVMNNATSAYKGVPLHPVDARCAEKLKAVQADRTIWRWLGKDVFLPLQIETTLSNRGKPPFPSGNWFWHPNDHSVLSREEILNLRHIASQMNANLLLNCGIMANGKLRPEDEGALLVSYS
jgi:alpha-L-fucosidase